MKIFIDSNCPENKILLFDMLATATNLYEKADVVLDASRSNNICFALNTSYTILLSSKTGGINDDSLVLGLDEFYKNKQFADICLKDSCEVFMKKTLNHFYNVEMLESINLNKKFSVNNISRNDVLIFKEFLNLGVSSPFFIRFPHQSSSIFLDKNGILCYDNKKISEFDIDDINDFIKASIEIESINNTKYLEFLKMLNNNITPVYFDRNIDVFNKVVTEKLIVDYKRRFRSFLKKIYKGDELRSYLGYNKNTITLYDMIGKYKDLFETFIKK